ncbi:cation:proton antiporter [Clostridiisalibacter paucivorans]|uniref:cation:proton antiporter n=1 Tax=Clostridiisalibacter paucivorans TaxID=408753 RepID=UPI00047E78E4|nr:cation:proton antiporter [Clostridiisalibacter paucivorans]
MGEGFKFLLDLALILLFANLGGYISRKLKQPAVLGQIIAGLVIGPSVLNIVKETEFISYMAEIGVILLMFIAGLETDIDDLKSSSKSSASVALGGVVFPLLLGFLAVKVMKPQSDITEGLFVGVILTATSVSITVQALREMNRLRTKQGIAVLGAAIIDDVVGIILLTLVVGLINPTSGSGELFFVVGKIIVFFLLSIGLGMVFSKYLTRYKEFLSREDRVLVSALIFCFLAAFFAESLGVAAIIGAYFTGIVFSTTPHRNRVSFEVQKIAYSIFTPVFFVNIGLFVRLDDVGGNIGLTVVIIIAAILGKVIGCGLGAKLSHFNNREALQISIGMIPRAEVALIVTNLGVKIGVITKEVFASIILLVLVSTIITPILLKIAYDDKPQHQTQ